MPTFPEERVRTEIERLSELCKQSRGKWGPIEVNGQAWLVLGASSLQKTALAPSTTRFNNALFDKPLELTATPDSQTYSGGAG